MQIGVIDYGVGNVANVMRCLEYTARGDKILRVCSEKELLQCDKVVLPGVGAFRSAMQHLEQMQLIDSIREFAKSGRYILGICLGMQLLFKRSFEFGECDGLGLIEGEVVRFDFVESNLESNSLKAGIGSTKDNSSNKRTLKIPHIGWNKNFKQKHHNIMSGLNDIFYLYFVHSYHAHCDEEFILSTCYHGIQFPSIVSKENIIGIQPHPERSHEVGFKIMQNFLQMK